MRKNKKTIILAKLRRELRRVRPWLDLEQRWNEYKELDKAEKEIQKSAERLYKLLK